MFSSNVIFWLFISTSGLIFLVVGAVVFQLRKASKKALASESSEEKMLKDNRFDSFLKMRGSFREAAKFLKRKVTGRNYQYQIPWYLVIGESGSGKSTMLKNVGLGTPICKKEGNPGEEDQGVQWWFFDKGVAIEPKGEFVLKDDGKSSNENGWQNVITLLKRYRPNRPIDGVILTLPIDDLIWDQGNKNDKRETLNQKTIIIYNKLWELQGELGIHFPVYVLFTKCDAIKGFSSYCHELPGNLQRNMVGWSNPNSLDVAYSSKLMDQAIDNIHEGLFKTQIEIFAAKPNVADGSDLFELPNRFKSLLDPIKTAFDNIFKESSFHRSFFFRGIYFSGSDTTGENQEKKPKFLRDLFDKKIFPEKGLAKVVDQAMLSKHRTLRIVQVAFVLMLLIGGGGLTNTYFNLRKEKQVMLPVLNLISSSLVDLQYKKTIDRSLFEKKGLSLLNGMSEIDPSGLTSVFMPSSWTSTLQSQLVSCMTIAYKKIIMRMMYIELNNKVRAMGFVEKQMKDDEDSNQDKVFRIEKTAEFKQLLAFIKSLEELEKNIAIYNNQLVTGSANSREFLQVVAYLYNIDLKGSFSEEALAKLRGNPVGTEILKANVNAKIWELTRDFYDRVYEENPLNSKLVQLKDNLRTIHRDHEGNDEQNIVVRFQNLLASLNTIERELSEPEFAWMVSTTFELGNRYDQILESVQNSGFLGQPVFVEMKRRGELEHKELQYKMVTLETRLTGPILQQENGKAILRFSPKMTTLKKALDDFFAMKFADIENARTNLIKELPPSTRIVWNTQLLAQAVKLYEPYNLFLSEKLNDFPIELQPIFEQVARESLETNMTDLIGRAQKLETIPKIVNPSFAKEALRSEVLNFKESSKHISELLGIFDRLELHKTNRLIFRVVAVQGNRILDEIDRLLQEDNLYMVKDNGFGWWNGQKSPVFAAYNVNDVEELKYYFAIQRDRVRFLTNEYAMPIISLLGYQNKNRGYVNLPLVKKWERIIAAFESFEKKKPGNSILILEDFIMTGINEIAAKSCTKEIPNHVLQARSNDFFLAQRNDLRKKIYQRCQRLSFEREIREF